MSENALHHLGSYRPSRWAFFVFFADFANDLPVCSACFYSPGSIVEPSGVQFTVIKQVASDTDLIRPCDRPCINGSITRVVRGKPHAETLREPGETFAYSDIAESPALGADPQRMVLPAAENSWPHDVKVKHKIWNQDLGYFKLVRLFGLGFLPRNDHEPPISHGRCAVEGPGLSLIGSDHIFPQMALASFEM
jgi:hypothetical protein